ncbi:hypothetical protein NLU13_1277 [Sarocladium strictum]|uniref:Proline dehydrogenase n=1 Tax=Sarocladium strictum TaxID=5046 RepID=A0AA39GQN3_SARSR|nr:hypothetical protein NLU13_1277 [Sarocladium strictum]
MAEPSAAHRAPLSVLPLSMVLRSLATTTVSSSPMLLSPSLAIMGVLAHSTNPLLNPDRNPILRWFLKNTFYAQFCAGENAAEVRQTIARLKGIGFTGVLLGYAKEVVLSDKQAENLASGKLGEETEELIKAEIAPWAEGTLETFTGAGSLALYRLQQRLPATPYLAKSIDTICSLAHERGVRLLFDAEQDILQDGIDDWTMHYAEKYNKDPDHAIIHGTYQAYKKCVPQVLAEHLVAARQGNFTLGVKLVRGAYLGSDPRNCFWDTKEQTDECYNSLASAVLTQQWSPMLPGEGEFPHASLVLATHNAESVRRARAICDAGAAKSEIAFAQLQGMADEVSCELVEASHSPEREAGTSAAMPTYKYLVWGTTGECMKYLLRRAHENKDAVQRTRSGRDAMWAELVRRCKAAVGL